jgi:hypothetical protein
MTAKNIGRMMRLLAIALVATVFIGKQADAEIIMTIGDDGTDLTMTATGSYDLSLLEPSASTLFLGINASVGPSKSTFGWDTGGEDDPQEYSVEFIGSFTGTGFANGATSTTGTSPFFFYGPGGLISLPAGAPQIGEVNETAVFEGVTLASLGMVAGETINVVWEGDSAIIQTIPAPASVGLLALVSGGIYFARRRFMI